MDNSKEGNKIDIEGLEIRLWRKVLNINSRTKLGMRKFWKEGEKKELLRRGKELGLDMCSTCSILVYYNKTLVYQSSNNIHNIEIHIKAHEKLSSKG